jgi:hypothetical protein
MQEMARADEFFAGASPRSSGQPSGHWLDAVRDAIATRARQRGVRFSCRVALIQPIRSVTFRVHDEPLGRTPPRIAGAGFIDLDE